MDFGQYFDPAELQGEMNKVLEQASKYAGGNEKLMVRLNSLDHTQKALLAIVTQAQEVAFDNATDKAFKKLIKNMSKEYATGNLSAEQMRMVTHLWIGLAVVDFVDGELNDD